MTVKELREALAESMKREKSALNGKRRAEAKAARANLEVTRLTQENNRLKLQNRTQEGWLNAEGSYTRRYNALEKRVGLIREILRDDYPEKYGEDGAWNSQGARDPEEALKALSERQSRLR